MQPHVTHHCRTKTSPQHCWMLLPLLGLAADSNSRAHVSSKRPTPLTCSWNEERKRRKTAQWAELREDVSCKGNTETATLFCILNTRLNSTQHTFSSISVISICQPLGSEAVYYYGDGMVWYRFSIMWRNAVPSYVCNALCSSQEECVSTWRSVC